MADSLKINRCANIIQEANWGLGKKGGMTENQDIGNGYIGNPIYPGL
jgi:hypothetical protein